MKMDLHMHSRFSDGEDSPAELVRQAKDIGLEIISLTDHDTVDGLDEFIAEGEKLGVRTVTGIELSSERHKEIHILGYGIDYRSPDFVVDVARLKEVRAQRNSRILSLLRKYKVFLSEEDITPKTGETIGRMHIAKAMKRKGYVQSIGEAFDRYLAHGKKAYVRSCRIRPEEAIDIIHRAGGNAVLAHPMKLQLTAEDLERTVCELKGAGLSGLEAYYTGHTRQQTEFLADLAARLGLAVTVGSDYHGKLRANALGGVEANVDYPF